MFSEYVEILEENARQCFGEMTDMTMLGASVSDEIEINTDFLIVHGAAYTDLNTRSQGIMAFGFVDEKAALTAASAIAGKMGLPPVSALDDVAGDVLAEFLNTVLGHTVSAMDRKRLPLRFEQPFSIQPKDERLKSGDRTAVFSMRLSSAFTDIKARVLFREDEFKLFRGKRILVVDDSDVIRAFVTQTLKDNGAEIEQAVDGREAIERHEIFQPHLTLMDVVMPNMGGLEAIAAILETESQARFIVLTSTSRRDQILTAKKLGVLTYILKPPKKEVIINRVSKAFEIMGK